MTNRPSSDDPGLPNIPGNSNSIRHDPVFSIAAQVVGAEAFDPDLLGWLNHRPDRLDLPALRNRRNSQPSLMPAAVIRTLLPLLDPDRDGNGAQALWQRLINAFPVSLLLASQFSC